MEQETKMKEFEFFCDSKQTVWLRQKAIIKAESYDKALEFLSHHKDYDVLDIEAEAPDDITVNLVDSEILFETMEGMEAKDNGAATIEWYDRRPSNSAPIYTNDRYEPYGTLDNK